MSCDFIFDPALKNIANLSLSNFRSELIPCDDAMPIAAGRATLGSLIKVVIVGWSTSEQSIGTLMSSLSF